MSPLNTASDSSRRAPSYSRSECAFGARWSCNVMIEDLVGVMKYSPSISESLPASARPASTLVRLSLEPRGYHEAVYGGVLACLACDGVEVQTVAAPVLQGDVAQIRALADVELDRPVAQGGLVLFGPVRGILVYVGDARIFFDDDERARHRGADR